MSPVTRCSECGRELSYTDLRHGQVISAEKLPGPVWTCSWNCLATYAAKKADE